jgi:hypothetical protein
MPRQFLVKIKNSVVPAATMVSPSLQVKPPLSTAKLYANTANTFLNLLNSLCHTDSGQYVWGPDAHANEYDT